ncbi:MULTISPECIES: hypothetical protein [Nitrospirillum]|nr:hypothetical protein [Nitrospirillum amazonense]MEC4591260.1 hypothetical protein [Nitrospirillum amazonense]TWB34884.1 hypothetical protein FBZ91_111216 [Nitrospirillum amazonense]
MPEPMQPTRRAHRKLLPLLLMVPLALVAVSPFAKATGIMAAPMAVTVTVVAACNITPASLLAQMRTGPSANVCLSDPATSTVGAPHPTITPIQEAGQGITTLVIEF